MYFKWIRCGENSDTRVPELTLPITTWGK